MRSLIAILFLNAAAAAQISVYGGDTLVYGNSILNGPATYTNAYVVYPPPPPSNNYSNFTANVMTQNAIDGVTLLVPWNVVELTSSPSTSGCSPVGTDVCQQDQTNPLYYHTYSWVPIDGTGCLDMHPNSSSPWFCAFGGVYKSVNFVLAGVSDVPTNGFTPAYVTSSNWMTAVSASQPQDVVNTINASGCGIQYSGSITSIPVGTTFTGSAPHSVNVTWPGMLPVGTGDTIWVSGLTGAASSLNVTGQNGATVSTSCGMGVDFCYNVSVTASGTGAPTSVVKAVDSWPVPYELPYASGWLAFLRAAIYHFNNLNYSGRSWQNQSRIRYIRPGVAQGGEARPICTTYAPMTGASPPFTEGVWTNGTNPTGWYTQVVQAVQSANPLMQIMFSINAGETTLVPIDASFANDEAMVAVSYNNSTGLYDGFGSQGLGQSDTGFSDTACPEAGTAPDTGNNWGCMFTKYWSGSNTTYGTMGPYPTTVPLELQQIDCSNPTTVYDAQDGCFLGNTGGDTGSLVTLYAFATKNHASILELYNQDALLAYDPNFCLPAVSPPLNTCQNMTGYDWFGTGLSPSTQYNFYVNAGQGTPGCSGGSCPYANAINTAHGPH